MPNVRVRPKDANATHDISLSDGVNTWGITLKEGARGIQESPATPTNIRITGGGTKFGDYDPMMSHIEQRDWSGGRGQEYFVDDPTRFYDSWEAWSLTPGKLFQSPQINYSSGYRGEDTHYPGNVIWKPLIRDERYQGQMITASTTFSAHKVYQWIRKVGNPGTLTVVTCATAAGDTPSSAASTTITLASSSVDGPMSEWHAFALASSQAISSGGKYFVKTIGAATDNLANHWEIGCNSTTANVWASSDGQLANWVQKAWKPYYRVVDADKNRKWHFAQFGNQTDLYAVSQYDDSTTASTIIRCSTGATPDWSPMTASGTALSGVVLDVCITDGIANCARGSTVATFKFQIDSTGTGIVGSTVTGTTAAGADMFWTSYDPVDGAQLWKAMSTAVVYRSALQGFASAPTWTPSTGIPVGDKAQPIIGLVDYNDQMWVRKKDSLWSIKNDRAAKLPAGIGANVETVSYSPMLPKDLFLYFPWSHSLERLYGGTLDDIGPWKGAGLPSSRAGTISCLEAGVGILFAGIDAGTTGYSGVFVYDGRGWHEIYRCQEAGRRVQNLHWQPVSGSRARLWISVGGDLIYLLMPLNTMNPLRDAAFTYQHEFMLTTSTIDMGASQLPKLFHQLHVIADNLGEGKEIHAEYQLDDNIGSSSWNQLSYVNASPSAQLKIDRGDKVAIRLRLRGVTNVATTPTVVNATVLEGVARTPTKRQWNIRSRTGTFQVTQMGLKDTDPDSFYAWFQDASVMLKPLHMRAKWKALDDLWVFAEAPTVARDYTTPAGEWGATFGITVREI